MNLTKLRDEVKRLVSLKEDRKDCIIDMQLEAIRLTVDSVDEFMVFVHHGSEVTRVDLTNIPFWKEIKELLTTHNKGK